MDEKYLIEYDGEQHFQKNDFFGGEKAFLERQERDLIKTQWCKEHNIPLIRIPYTKYETLYIEDLLLETSKFIIK